MAPNKDLVFLVYTVLTLTVLYHIITEMLWWFVLLGLMYAAYRYLQKSRGDHLPCTGQGVLITGCDTGFGHHAAIKLSSLGYTVFAGCLLKDSEGAKKLQSLGTSRTHVIQLDVTKKDEVDEALKYVRDHCQKSGLWAVINNAAINQLGDIELVSLEVMKRVAEVNFFGMVRVTKAFLPLLKNSKGRVINITSVRGRVALATDVSYTCTKWAGEAFSDILRREMHRFGVGVVIIEPGNYGGLTGMLNTENIKRNEVMLNSCWELIPKETQRSYGRDYLDHLLSSLRDCGSSTHPTLNPVLESIVEAVTNVQPQHRYLIHGSNRWLDWYCVVAFLNSYLPESLMDLIIRSTDPLPKVAKDVA